ncbi:hypothetical protein LTR01_006857 [Friedmanniomyces endolithicus]|nr:hypothetical protein LTR01_006857 [Friedmanniomyces endolithicus]
MPITTHIPTIAPFVKSTPFLEQLSIRVSPSRMTLESKRSRAFDDQRASFVPRRRVPVIPAASHTRTMPSSKGEPTDPELREKVKEEVKGESKGNIPSPSTASRSCLDKSLIDRSLRLIRWCWLIGGGAGKWSAWKAGEMARRYEDAGGEYRDTGENRNEAKKGAPVKKERK